MDSSDKSSKSKTQISDRGVHLVYCFICQIAWKSSGFISHYIECRNLYNKRCISKERPLVEPAIITALISKLKNGEDITLELNDYNLIATDISFDLLSKECPNCNKKFLPDAYLIHLEKCRKRISVNTVHFQKLNEIEESETGDFTLDKKQRRKRKKSMDNLKLITKDEVKYFKKFNIALSKYKDAPY